MSFETTAARLWKRLPLAERQKAASAFFREPVAELQGSALAAIAKARNMRPQAARTLAAEAQASALATVLEPGEALASTLLVSLHLGHRRPLLAAFLEALGLGHTDGILKEEAAAAPPAEEAARAAVRSLEARFPRSEIEVYLNTLWLQDPERWQVLGRAPDWF